jgi:hypothetical protein
MRWHKEGVCEDDRVMVHPSDCEAWKAFYSCDANFTSDARNVRIRLATHASHRSVQMSQHTLVGPSSLFHTTYNLLFA